MIYRYLEWKFFIKRSTEELALYTTAFNTNFSRINKAICYTHEYYTYISEISNRHIQNPLWNLFVFAVLWRFMRHSCMPIQLRWYYDTDYYRNLQNSSLHSKWCQLVVLNFPMCYYYTLCYVEEIPILLEKLVYIIYAAWFFTNLELILFSCNHGCN